MAGELATPEELAAREQRAAADRPDLPPYEALAGAHAPLTDDELAEQIGAHPDGGLFLALWRRLRDHGWAEKDVQPGEDVQQGEHVTVQAQQQGTVSVADQLAAGVAAGDTVTVAAQRQGTAVPER